MPLAGKEAGIREAWLILRDIIKNLREFLDTDDYSFVERAHELGMELKSRKELLSELSGHTDLINNLASMYEKVKQHGGNMPTLEHGLLVQQAVYTISRANIMCVGLEFKVKRARGG